MDVKNDRPSLKDIKPARSGQKSIRVTAQRILLHNICLTAGMEADDVEISAHPTHRDVGRE